MAPSGNALAAERAPRDLAASAWLLVDGRSGVALAAKDARAAQPVASATKLMTYRVAAHDLGPGRRIRVEPYDAAPGESLAGFRAGSRVRVRDLLYGLMLASGNDAAHTLTVATAGSEAAFVERMRREARRLGLDDTTFADPIGFAGNASSPRDLADLTLELRRDALFKRVAAAPRAVVRSGKRRTTLVNRNRLVRRTDFVDGVKTGTTLEAGYVLVASAERRGVPLVSVVLGAPSESARDRATLRLLEFGFGLYEERAVVREGERVGATKLATGERVPLIAGAAVREITREDQRATVRLAGLLPAPVEASRGEPLGTAVVRLDGRVLARVPAFAARDVRPPGSAESRTFGWALAIALGVSLALLVTGLLLARRRRSAR